MEGEEKSSVSISGFLAGVAYVLAEAARWSWGLGIKQ